VGQVPSKRGTPTESGLRWARTQLFLIPGRFPGVLPGTPREFLCLGVLPEGSREFPGSQTKFRALILDFLRGVEVGVGFKTVFKTRFWNMF